MIEEILDLGFSQVELGYDLTANLAPGVKKMVEEDAVTVASVHAFCPTPLLAPVASPELFTLASRDRAVRERAVLHVRRTLDFAAEIGARVVVLHCGYVHMRILTRRLQSLYHRGRQFSPAYERTMLKLLARRDRKAMRHLEYLYAGLDALLPVLESTGIRLALEITPLWEAVPTETEMELISKKFGAERVSYWHDLGHSQIRENLGLINHARVLERLLPCLAGAHIHDVAEPDFDHLMPPHGNIDFARFKFLAQDEFILVLEPSPMVSRDELVTGMARIRQDWGEA